MKNETALKVARYFLYRASFDGDLITPLKMQKLLYYAYVWVLVKNKKLLFDEKFQAWTNGPVLPTVYKTLKVFGSSPINENFMDGFSEEEILQELEKELGSDVFETLNEVYAKYIIKSAFELSAMTHNELPWSRAREGFGATENSDKELSDDDIIAQYGKSQKEK